MSRVKRVSCGDVNCHLVQGKQGALLVDAGRAGYGEKLLALCQRWDVRLIVLTHGHLDHVQNAAFLAERLGAPIAMHRADAALLEALMACATTDGAADLLDRGGLLKPVMGRLMERIAFHLQARAPGLGAQAVVYTNGWGISGRTGGADALLARLKLGRELQ